MKDVEQFIHFIKSGNSINNKRSLNVIEQRINDLSSVKLPVLPSIIVENDILDLLKDEKVFSHLFTYIENFECVVGNKYGDVKNPMLLEITISSNIFTYSYPNVRNLGLTKKTIESVKNTIGEKNTRNAILSLLDSIILIYEKLLSLESNKKNQKKLEKRVRQIKELRINEDTQRDLIVILDDYGMYLPKYFFEDEKKQIEKIIFLIMRLSILNSEDISVIIKPIIYGDNICYGSCFTRNIETGEEKLDGIFCKNYYLDDSNEKNIYEIEEKYLKELKKIALKIEEKKCEIYKVDFVITAKKLYLLDALPVKKKKEIAKIKLLLDLYNKKLIKAEDVVMSIKIEDLNKLLYPSFDNASIKDFKSLEGGISGAMGSAVGKVYFSNLSLMNAKKIEPQENYILCVNEISADDVKAIELSSGVLSKAFGYASHAAVVARQYGKVSIIYPDMIIENGKAIIGDISIKEGDYISLHAPYFSPPTIYFGKAKLIFSNMNNNDLSQLISIASTFIKNFNARANVDSPEEAKLSIALGAFGIGLCRTEHMFFKEERKNVFREMIIAETVEERKDALTKLKEMQRADFYEILKIVSPLPVTIRLLDFPIHEILPKSKDEFNAFFNYLSKKKNYTEAQLNELIFLLKETNPMLGCRGCRMAIIHPEIYKMQLEALFEAMSILQLEGTDTNVEILIPLVMNARELKQIRYGKLIEGKIYFSIEEIEENVKNKFKIAQLHYKVGAMIELPSSALSAGELARYSNFFSFGTNDLTQTTLGLSRDDFTSFASSYSMYDLLENNPFAILDENVKELMEYAIVRARLTRPEVVFGLCGEHALEPKNIHIFMEMGGNYVSCHPYAIPKAIFTIAQAEISRKKKK